MNVRGGWTVAAAVALTAALGAPLAAQPAPPDSAVYTPPRWDWLSDRVSLRVGDILTVYVEEKADARERVSRTATGARSMRGSIDAQLDTDRMNYGLNAGLAKDSRDMGEEGRSGGLTTVIAVRVTAVEPNGVLRVQGSRKVTVDGRTQEVTLQGLVRPEDVDRSHLVRSQDVAEASVTYKGKKIPPRSGLVGKLLGMVWP